MWVLLDKSRESTYKPIKDILGVKVALDVNYPASCCLALLWDPLVGSPHSEVTSPCERRFMLLLKLELVLCLF